MNLIGQFGVGFYSVFLVADDVKVAPRAFLKGEDPGREPAQRLAGSSPSLVDEILPEWRRGGGFGKISVGKKHQK